MGRGVLSRTAYTSGIMHMRASLLTGAWPGSRPERRMSGPHFSSTHPTRWGCILRSPGYLEVLAHAAGIEQRVTALCLQCVAVSRSVCVAVCCRALECAAGRCSVLSVLQWQCPDTYSRAPWYCEGMIRVSCYMHIICTPVKTHEERNHWCWFLVPNREISR